ncbi:MAG: membrane protein [Rhodomicrobium sp.]|nr:MAG: membrane protein [Rhodomicrobium sp.]
MTFFMRFVTFILLAMVVGLGLTSISLSTGSGLAAKRLGGWKSWKSAGHQNADPYTRAYVAKTGQLPLPPQIAQTYFALYDNAHRRLHTSCSYLVESPAVEAKWWTLAVYDLNGKIFKNDVGRYSFNAGSAMTRFNGGFRVFLSQSPQPDNWLPIGEYGQFVLVYRLYRKELTDQQVSDEVDVPLPLIKRVSC